MRLCNSDVDAAERNRYDFEEFDDPEEDEEVGRTMGWEICGVKL